MQLLPRSKHRPSHLETPGRLCSSNGKCAQLVTQRGPYSSTENGWV